MQSPMVKNLDYINNKKGYSELQVLRSQAGWYVGTTYTEDGVTEPGSRDSGYFPTREEADQYLDIVLSAENPQEYLRDQP